MAKDDKPKEKPKEAPTGTLKRRTPKRKEVKSGN